MRKIRLKISTYLLYYENGRTIALVNLLLGAFLLSSALRCAVMNLFVCFFLLEIFLRYVLLIFARFVSYPLAGNLKISHPR